MATIGLPSAEQLDAAVAAAVEAFPVWSGLPAGERAELLHEVAARLRARTDELARVMTLEGGKPLVENSTRSPGPRRPSTTTPRWAGTSPAA